MLVETKEIEYCKLFVKYQADVEKIKEKRQEAVNELRKVAIPGFRKGKAPDYAIRARCKNQINDLVMRQMVSTAYDDVIFETKVKPIGQPKIEKVSLKDNNFTCEITVSKKPAFELKQFKELELKKPEFNRDVDSQVQKSVNELLTQFGDISPYQEGDFVSQGDQVTMDFHATIDGQDFDGSMEAGTLYTIGQNTFPGFDNNLLGMAAGEDREFDLTFPDELPNIGGKTAHFKVHVHMGTKRVPCEPNDEFAAKVGMKTFDEVKEKITIIVNHRIKQTETRLLRQQVAGILADSYDFEVPVWLWEIEAKHIALNNKIDWSKLEDSEKEFFKKQALNNVRLSLVLDSIRDAEQEAVLSDMEAINSIKQQVVAQGNDPEKFVVESQKSGSLFGLVAAMKDEFTLQWVAEKAKFNE